MMMSVLFWNNIHDLRAQAVFCYSAHCLWLFLLHAVEEGYWTAVQVHMLSGLHWPDEAPRQKENLNLKGLAYKMMDEDHPNTHYLGLDGLSSGTFSLIQSSG